MSSTLVSALAFQNNGSGLAGEELLEPVFGVTDC